MGGFKYSELELGQKATFTKTISESDVYLFAGISGDTNPMHLDKTYAEQTPFGQRIAHGMLTAGLISTVIGVHLPGPGSVYMSQSLKFMAPVKFGDTITASAEIIDKNDEKKRVTLKTECVNQDGTVVLTGEALVKAP